MFMRRGCLLGCGGWLIACVAIALLGWFVVIPRVTDTLSDSLADSVSTIIADEIEPSYSRSQLQQGADIRFSFAELNRAMQTEYDDEVVDTLRVRSSGNQLLIEAELNDQSFEVGFTPHVADDGTLRLDFADDGGWWQRQILGVASDGFEKGINEWLDRNDLRLTDITLDGDTIIFSVTGK